MGEKELKKIMLTGGRPTGNLHLGHYVGAFKKFIQLQDQYDNYFIISDLHMLTTKSDKKDILSIHENSINMFIDCIGMGFDPQKTIFYLQSNVPELTYLFVLIQNLVTVKRVESTPSLSEMSKHANMKEMSLGLLAYPVLEAGDIIALGADIVPVGKDNIDHIKITQEIVEIMNRKYEAVFKKPNCITSDDNYIIGLDGANKMSKSLNNAIFIRDDKESIINKINGVAWPKNSADNGRNIIIEYLKIFGKDNDEVDQLLEDYKNNKEIEKNAKEILIKVLIDMIEPMHERMNRFIKNPKKVDEFIKSGTQKARDRIKHNLGEIRAKIGLFNYFN